MTRRLLILSAALAASAVAPAAAQNAANPFPQIQQPGVQQPAGVQPVRDPLTPAANSTATPPTSGRAANTATTRTLNLEQKAWENPNATKTSRQTYPGFIRIPWTPYEVPQINVREGMLTVIKFPGEEDIVTNVVSDPGSFETSVSPNRHSIAVRSLYAGVDGNLIVYGKSNNVYNFYLRSIPFNAPRLPDTTVQITVGGMSTSTGETVAAETPESQPYEGYKDLFSPSAQKASAAFKKGAKDFARSTPVAGVNMSNNIEIKVREAKDQAIAPVRAWHDDHFTYLDFGPRASSMTQWPVAALVIQGVESPVGTRVTGRDRSMMVVEGLGDIVLRNGQLMVCLKTVAPNNDNRYAIPPRVNDDPRPASLVDRTEIVHVADRAAPATISKPEKAEPKERAKPAAKRAGGRYSVLYAPMTADTETLLWTAYAGRHPEVADRTQPVWISEAGVTLDQAPAGDDKALILVKGLTKDEAAALCPGKKPGPSIPSCKIKR